MKRIILFFALLNFINCMLFAQASTLCGAFGALIEESHTKFAHITGADLESETNYQRKESTITIKDATLCYIETEGIETYWLAEFGAFNTLEEAKTKIKLIQAEFISCVPKLEFVANPIDYFGFGFYLKENIDGGFIFYKGELSINRDSDKKYIPYMKIPENANPITFVNITNNADTSAFARDIKYALSESKTAFQIIRGSQISSDMFNTTYNATLCLTGALGCEITESIADKYYDAYYGTNLSATTADTLLKQLEGVVAYALGNKYVWQNMVNGMGFTELSEAGETSIPILEVKKEKAKDDNFDVLIHVRQQ